MAKKCRYPGRLGGCAADGGHPLWLLTRPGRKLPQVSKGVDSNVLIVVAAAAAADAASYSRDS